MPALLMICTIILFTLFWAEKYIILRYASRPPNYNEKMVYSVLDILPISLLLHLGVGIYSYGTPDIFPYFDNKNNLIQIDVENIKDLTKRIERG